MREGMNRRKFLRGSAAAGALALPVSVALPATAAPGQGPGTPPTVARTTVEYAPTLLSSGPPSSTHRPCWAPTSRRRGSRGPPRAAVRGRPRTRCGSTACGTPARSPPRARSACPTAARRSRRTPGIAGAYGSGTSVAACRRGARPTWWETGFLDTPWQARWIGAAPVESPPGFDGASWVWSPGATPSDAPPGPRWFRGAATLPGEVARALLVATADDDFTLYLGGGQVLHAPEQVDGWRTGQFADVTAQVAAGEVVLAALATNRGDVSINPAGLLVPARGRPGRRNAARGRHRRHWRVADTEQNGWQRPDFDDSGLGAGGRPRAVRRWALGKRGRHRGRRARRRCCAASSLWTVRWRRRGCTSRGLAYYDAELNGAARRHAGARPRVHRLRRDRAVRDPRRDRPAFQGANEIAVTLGRGFYGMTTPNVWNWHQAPGTASHGCSPSS